MARPSNPEIRAALREQAVDYVLSHGMADLTLRPLAKALKTNARMLVYHFGSREGLMREILAGLRERGDARVRKWLRSTKAPPAMPEFLLWYWRLMSDPRLRATTLLIFELYALALRDPRRYPGVLTDPVRYWQQLVRKTGASRRVTSAEATLLLAATRGFLLDLCATEDRARVGKAVRMLARMLQRELAPRQ
jgi:AcrR family transcriptional regulator